jgi:hypothetical protein
MLAALDARKLKILFCRSTDIETSVSKYLSALTVTAHVLTGDIFQLFS